MSGHPEETADEIRAEENAGPSQHNNQVAPSSNEESTMLSLDDDTDNNSPVRVYVENYDEDEPAA